MTGKPGGMKVGGFGGGGTGSDAHSPKAVAWTAQNTRVVTFYKCHWRRGVVAGIVWPVLPIPARVARVVKYLALRKNNLRLLAPGDMGAA